MARTVLLPLLAAFLCALVAVPVTRAASQATEPPARLTNGTPIERAISGRQEHIYQLALKAGDAADLVVEQRGIDVFVRVRDAAGALIAEFDADARKQGREVVGVIAESPSDYRVSVLATYSRAAAGRYEIRVGEIRPSTDRDRDLFEAHRLSTESAALETAAKYDDAQRAAARALELGEKALGANDAYVADLLTRLGTLRRTAGDTKAAEQLFVRALGIDRAVLGTNHAQTAHAASVLGALYSASDDYIRAAPLLEEAVATMERAVGPVHPRVASGLMTLSTMHARREDYDRALPELQRALTIAEATMEPGDFWLLAILNNLGNLYSHLDDYDRAVPLLERSLEGFEKRYGPDSPQLTLSLQNLGTIARIQKQYARALDLLSRAKAIREKTLGPRHAQTAVLLINIGNVYTDQHDYVRARDNFMRALDVLETAAGPYHSLTMDALASLTRTYVAEGDAAHALEYQTRLDRALEKNIYLNLEIGSEREKLRYLTATQARTSRTLSLNARTAPGDAAAAELGATAVLQRKGRVLDAMAGSLAALRRRMNADDQAALDRLGAATSELATLALNGPGRTPIAEYRQRLTSLEQQREKLESEISGRSAEFRAQSQSATLAAVQAAIPERAALVEFALYKPFDASAPVDSDAAFGAGRYLAYVLRHDGAVQWKDLGPASDIDDAVTALRGALRDPKRDDVTPRGRDAYRRVLQPIRAMLGDATRLLVSPDGDLNLVPFEAFVDEEGRYLVERVAVSYLTTGRDLLRFPVPRSSQTEPLIVADPLFGEPQQVAPTKTARRSIAAAADLSRVYFAPLAGTAEEARTIKALFPTARLLTGARATKTELARVNAPSILHIATHGFFLQEAASGASLAASGSPKPSRGTSATLAVQNPLLRSGLALSGANLDKNPADDGILTALEAANLNLWGTKLVTLSACDTGVGEVRSGEGVYGLRRAFFLAGAETLVMSLWPVSDYVTREIMSSYYRGLQKGLGRGDALRQAQLAMLARSSRRHPFYWASFIQAGEWANLDGKR